MDFTKQMDEMQIPQIERNEALRAALKTGNILLIDMALATGANPLFGGTDGERMLVHAVRSGNLELVKKLIHDGHMGTAIPIAMPMRVAISSEQIEIATWLLSQGAVMEINRINIANNHETVLQLLTLPEVKAKIEYEALEAVISTKKGNPAQILRALLEFLSKNSFKDLSKWIVNLADYLVDTDHVECFKVMMEFGFDLKYVNTKYCSATMKKFLEEHGITVLTF